MGIHQRDAKTIAKLIYPSPNIVWDRDKPSRDPCRILSMDRAKDLIGYYLNFSRGRIKKNN